MEKARKARRQKGHQEANAREAHLVPDQKREAAHRLEKAFGKGSKGANNGQ